MRELFRFWAKITHKRWKWANGTELAWWLSIQMGSFHTDLDRERVWEIWMDNRRTSEQSLEE